MSDTPEGPELPSYGECKAIIENLPQTWIPALLATMVETAIKKKVFKPGRINEFVAAMEAEES